MALNEADSRYKLIDSAFFADHRPLPGHGRMRVVRAAAGQFTLIAEVG